MKFISKSSNLLIVLRPGMSAQPLTGTPSVPTVSVRFKDGVAEVQQQELIDMMLANPAFNGDFICADDTGGRDPYLANRKAVEPAHIMTELKHGTPVTRETKGGDASNLSPEMMKLITTMAGEMAKAMLPQMVEATLKSLVAAGAPSNATLNTVAPAKAKGKPGRKPGFKPTKAAVVAQVEAEGEEAVV